MTRHICILLLLLSVLFLTPDPALSQEAAKSPASGSERYFTDVVLVDQSGEKKRLYSDLLKDHVVVINSFMTTCKSACPVINKSLQAIQTAAGEKLGSSVYILSISVDPVTDTPERLREYAKQSHSRAGWYFLTGEKANVDFALRKFGLYVDNKEDHITVVIMGNEGTGLWKKAAGVGNSEEFVKTFESVFNDVGPEPSSGVGAGMGTGVGRGLSNPSATTPARTGPDGELIYSMSNVDQKPVILSKPKANYTEQARSNKTRGAVIVRMILTAKGTVENVTVVRGLPDGLSDNAVEAARKIKFQPGLKDGKPVSVSISVEYGFHIY